MLIYPSLIAGNLLNIGHDIKTLEPYSTGFHIDIMDFHFVPNLTWGPPFVEAIRKITNKELWVHLMVDDPLPYIPLLPLIRDDIITVHREQKNFQVALQRIKVLGCKVGLAYNPTTQFENDLQFLAEVDQVLLMSVEPGFSWQQFIPEVLLKINKLAQIRNEHNLSFLIALDGGIKYTNIAEIAQHGADSAAVGSGIFGTADPVTALKLFHKSLD